MRGKLDIRKKPRMTVFWRFFSSFFVLILVPSIIASLFTYVYVVRIIEREVEETSSILISHFAKQTDELVDSVRDDMLKLLSYSSIPQFLRYQDAPSGHPGRLDTVRALTDEINSLVHNHPLVHSAYLYQVSGTDVLSNNWGRMDKALFFRYLHVRSDANDEGAAPDYSGRLMMHFTEPLVVTQKQMYVERVLSSEPMVSAVMSYPFNTHQPQLYLVVNLHADRLAEQIAIPDAPAIETAIINENGDMLAYAGQRELHGESLLQAMDASSGTHVLEMEDRRRIQATFDRSDQYPWYYVSMSDLDILRQPAKLIQQASLVLLLFFLITGLLLSYYFSHKLYTPIREIKKGLEASRKDRPEGNEFELIKQWSTSLMSENKDLTTRVTGMSPVMHEYFLTKVLLGEFRDELSVSYYTDEIGFDARPGGKLAVFCMEIDYWDRPATPLTETDKSFKLIDLRSTIDASFAGKVWLCQTRPDLLACIVHLPDGSPEETVSYAERLRELLEQQASYFHAAIGVGKTVQEVWELHQSYQHANRLLKRKGMHAGVEICREGEDEEANLAVDSFLPADKVKQMLSLYQAGRYDLMLEKVHQLVDEAVHRRASASAVKQLCVDILNTWLRAVVEERRADFSIEQHAVWFQRLQHCISAEELRQFFAEIAAELFQRPEEMLETRDFSGIVQYIQQNYHQELSIEQFAQQLNMSVGHFSRSFKEAVGEKYIDFITRCRMEAAKQLLLGTDMRIDDIATEVGYLGRHSFIRIFSKSEGVTPGKFRSAQRANS